MSAVPRPGEAWSAQQRHWLEALGHVVYVQGALPPDAGDAAAPVAPRAESRAEPMVAERRADASYVPAPTPVRAQPPELDMPRPREDEPAPTPARMPSRLPDKLHFALIRASGCNPNAPGADALFAQWPSSSELRGDPAAKRALWPVLRALRRRGVAP